MVISRTTPLVLASGSARRKRLLVQIGLPFRSVESGMEESEIRGDPLEGACDLAEKKALDVGRRAEGSWILGADTVIAVDERTLGKPSDLEEAAAMLDLLAGREHRVITGLCLVDPAGTVAELQGMTTCVKIRPLSDREIRGYVETGEPMGKAGAYAIQGIGAFIVEGIEGSYTNVVGLPLAYLVKTLLRLGALESFPLSRG